MADQTIALQSRAPQSSGLGGAIQQNAQVINMMSQQVAAQRQAQQAQQAMQFAAAEEARKAELQGPTMDKARAEATAAGLKTALDFSNFAYTGLSNAATPAQAVQIAQRIGQQPQFQEDLFQGALADAMSTMPQDPAQFPAWKEDTLAKTLEGAKRLERALIQQNLGTTTRIVSAPKYGRGPATVLEGTEAEVTLKPTVVNVEGIGPIIVDPNTGQGFPAAAGLTGGYTPPRVPAGTPRGAPGAGGDTADVVYGFGKFAQPSKPISTMTIGEVQNFQKNELIPATRGMVGAGPDKGTGAVGTYQITYGTLQKYAPRVLGPNWRNTPFTADVQDRIAKAIYEDVKNGNLKDTWAGLPSNRPGAYSNVPWEQVRGQIVAVESAGAPAGRGSAGGAEEPPRTVAQAASAAEKQRKARTFQELAGVDLATQADTDTDRVSQLIKGSTSGVVEAVGAELVGALPESIGGGATSGMKNIGQLETIATTLTLAFAPDGRLSTGVSNEDRRVIERQLGVIQDPMVPSGKRLAAWGEVKRIMARTIGLTGAPNAKTPAPKGGVDMNNPLLRGM